MSSIPCGVLVAKVKLVADTSCWQQVWAADTKDLTRHVYQCLHPSVVFSISAGMQELRRANTKHKTTEMHESVQHI